MKCCMLYVPPKLLKYSVAVLLITCSLTKSTFGPPLMKTVVPWPLLSYAPSGQFEHILIHACSPTSVFMYTRFRSELQKKKKRSREAGKCVSGFEYQITLAQTLHHAAPELDFFLCLNLLLILGVHRPVLEELFLCVYVCRAQHIGQGVLFAGKRLWLWILFV